jgi:hypothetical protein
LQPRGIFELRTDVEDRAKAMLKALEDAGFQNPLGKGAFHPRPEGDVASTRERRYLVSGEPVYRARLVRPSARAAPGRWRSPDGRSRLETASPGAAFSSPTTTG